MTKTKIGTLLALLFSATLLATSFVSFTPKAKAAGMPTEEFKAKTTGIPASTIQTISAFDLNDAKVVGGGAKVPDPVAPGATAITSPDGNFKLIQGTRMFVEYANRAAIKDTGGKYQLLPGSITLQWDDAAVDRTTGKMLDVQLTLSGINLRLLDIYNKQKTFTRQYIESSRLVVLANWVTGPEVSHRTDLHAPGVKTPEDYYKTNGFSILSTITSTVGKDNKYSSWGNYTMRFLNKDGSENTGTYNMVFTDIDVAGFRGSPGKWQVTHDGSDKAQEHIKLLTPGDSLHVTNDTVLWTGSKPIRQAWATRDLAWNQTVGWALAHIRSGSTIETGNNGGMNLFAQLNPLFSKITVTKKGNGLPPGGTVPTDTNVNFTYEVENVGVSKVSGIKVTDSKGVEVTCPKTVLLPKEKMTCTGTGKVMGSPGLIAPPHPGDVKDPESLNED